MMRIENGTKWLTLVLAVWMGVFSTACKITRNRDGTVTIEAEAGEDPSISGVYYVTEINGVEYLTNGTYCVPRDGGQLVRCSTITLIPTRTRVPVTTPPVIPTPPLPVHPHPVGPPSTQPSLLTELSTGTKGSQEVALGVSQPLAASTSSLADSFAELVGDAGGSAYQVANGLDLWTPETPVVTVPQVIHEFRSGAHGDFLKADLLWRLDWKQPSMLDQPTVTIEAIVDPEVHVGIDGSIPGDTLVMYRLSGPAGAVRAVIEGMGTIHRVELGDSESAVDDDGNPISTAGMVFP